jgi:hypothetical protein
MSDDRDQDVIIFTEAIRLPVGQRGVFLERACAGDETLRRKVLDLLSAHERVGNFLENPPLGAGLPAGAEPPAGNGQRAPDANNDSSQGTDE